MTPSINAGVVLGVVHGYAETLKPYAMPELVTKIGHMEWALGHIPRVRGVTGALTTLQLRWVLD